MTTGWVDPKPLSEEEINERCFKGICSSDDILFADAPEGVRLLRTLTVARRCGHPVPESVLDGIARLADEVVSVHESDSTSNRATKLAVAMKLTTGSSSGQKSKHTLALSREEYDHHTRYASAVVSMVHGEGMTKANAIKAAAGIFEVTGNTVRTNFNKHGADIERLFLAGRPNPEIDYKFQ